MAAVGALGSGPAVAYLDGSERMTDPPPKPLDYATPEQKVKRLCVDWWLVFFVTGVPLVGLVSAALMVE
jgi:hypothetical protein